MLHTSRVLQILPKEIQPPEDIKCRGCVHAVWRLQRNRHSTDAGKMAETEAYCKIFFSVMYSTAEISTEVLDCDGFSDEVKDESE